MIRHSSGRARRAACWRTSSRARPRHGAPLDPASRLRGRLWWRLDQGIALLGAALALLGCGVGFAGDLERPRQHGPARADRSDAVGRLLEDHVVQTVKGADAVLKAWRPRCSRPHPPGRGPLASAPGPEHPRPAFPQERLAVGCPGPCCPAPEPVNEGVIPRTGSTPHGPLADERAAGRGWGGACGPATPNEGAEPGGPRP